jgi:hypothetical protein
LNPPKRFGFRKKCIAVPATVISQQPTLRLHRSSSRSQALAIRDDVGFFQVVKAAIVKNTDTEALQAQDMDSAIKQIISNAMVSDRVIDVFAAAGLKKPDISILQTSS